MRIFKTYLFARFAKQEGIDDKTLCDAIHRAEKGQIDADLGGGVIKQRIARPGQGKSRGYRTIIVFRVKDFSCFIAGFAKSDKENISQDELFALKKLAKEILAYTNIAITKALQSGFFIKVHCHEQNKNISE